MELNLLTICYLIASVTFILGLKMLSNPASARKGNLVAAAGMTIAIIGTIFLYESGGQRLHNYGWIFGGLLVGGIIGTLAAKKVKMTAMPEMVSLFNGMGGACAALISAAEFYHIYKVHQDSPGTAFSDIVSVGTYITIAAGAIIGTISYTGSIIAWGKLNGRVKDFSFKGQHIMNMIVLLLTLVAAVFAYRSNIGDIYIPFILIGLFAFIYGILFVMPIGGADMPVVISLLNSFTGVAAACGGFLYDNKAMLTGGILVGAAGTLLTILMCKAMNRSLTNVLIGSFGGGNKATVTATGKTQGNHKEISLADAAMLMAYA
ncbi:MAG: NAD(P)(+) transhydrogenase (Re/Si-specific) subunit beta, partial [Ferruginibacter sp.]|nr:NAD(P)(+) transhydrogenase (Re/Si-specific) subunit beta [Ferruginibacter sp.]